MKLDDRRSSANNAGTAAVTGRSREGRLIRPCHTETVRLTVARVGYITGRLALLILGIGAVALAACGSDRAATAVSETNNPPRQVRVATAAEAEVARTVTVTGTLAAEDQVILGAKVVGRVSEISVDLGSRVRKGQAIARIDPSDYRLRVNQAQAALQQARVRLGLPAEGGSDRVDPEKTALVRQAAAVLKEARQTHDRMVELWRRNLIAHAELDAAVSQLAVAEGRYQDAIEEARNRQAVLLQRRSELEIARQQLADAVIVSPMDGAVSERQASVGQYLAAGAPVATLVNIDPLRLRLAVPEREARAVRIGQAVKLTVEGDPTTYEGWVARLSPAIDEDNRTLLIEAEVRNAQGVLRPGSFAKAEIVVEAGQQIVTVPRDSITTFAGIEKVLTVAEGKVLEKRVRTGRRIGEAVEITEGVSLGDKVIVNPGNLVSGQAVTVVN
ncbi:MAG: efflux RND transporter periplasmic adaptor subunit [Deltaproteobacteria bacterium]|nr:efflux RND transporter periplasmic adaptor subunit [Deltaproteobacteria bacterium]